MIATNSCLGLDALPPPPSNKTGWPWTEAVQPWSETMPDGAAYPKISIVTPSYNQGQFLEETIRSVLLQGYPNLEYIIIDGGSQDNSVEIIRKYEPFLAYWISEPDAGQTNAINKGIRHSSGQIFAWLNSDDYYLPDTLFYIGRACRDHPFDLCYGQCEFVNFQGEYLYDWPYFQNLDLTTVIANNYIPQPSCFLNMQLVQESGLLNEGFQYAFDYEYWLRLLLKGAKITSIPMLFSKYRLHDSSKTQSSRHQFDTEMESIHQAILQTHSNSDVSRGIAQCYRRFAQEHYFWYGDRQASMAYFYKMLKIDPFACDIPTIKVQIKNLLNKRHHPEI